MSDGWFGTHPDGNVLTFCEHCGITTEGGVGAPRTLMFHLSLDHGIEKGKVREIKEMWCSTCGKTIPIARRYEDECEGCKQWWADNPPPEE